MPINENHPVLTMPERNIDLWRYMDIPSFLSLITSETLTFVRADLFEDKNEGILPQQTASSLELSVQQLVKEGKLVPEYTNFSSARIFNEGKKTVYLNCWCKENHEMVHMWKIYSKENGIAIKTDYERLKKSIESSEDVYPTEIRYLDYAHDYINWQANGLTAFTIKRKEYKSENEFRLLLAYPRIIEDQLLHLKTHKEIEPIRKALYLQTHVVHCKVNIAKLISKIYLSPYAPKWYYKVIADILEKYNLSNIEIIQSNL
ncbi:MAG: hypothetical protein JW802_01115 [Campylobacterales bacterium]|nr:hypothetical protein [Campylobacterales bacterium]